MTHAKENDYTFGADWSDMQIAVDMISYDSDLENEEPIDIIPHIKAWRENENHG